MHGVINIQGSRLEFVTCLKELANKCNFEADQFNIRVRDQFVIHLMSHKIMELFITSGDGYAHAGRCSSESSHSGTGTSRGYFCSGQGLACNWSTWRGPAIIVEFTSGPWRQTTHEAVIKAAEQGVFCVRQSGLFCRFS